MVRLGDICTFQSGGTPAKNDSSFFGGEIPWITTVALNGGIICEADAVDWITKKAIEHSAAKIVPTHSIMVGTRVGVGKVAINDVPMSTSQDIISLLNIDEMVWDKTYLCKVILSKNSYLSSQARGATIKGIKIDTLAMLEIPDLPIKEQKRISAVLDRVSDLISLRKQQLTKLDELVKARFVELFGTETEFDKWPCCTLGDVADVCVGVVIKPTQYYTDKGIPAFRSLNIGEMRVKDSDWVYFTEEGHQKNQKSVVHKNDVLVVRSGAPGTACVATEKYDGYNAVDIIIAHPDNNKVNSMFLAAFTNMPHGMNQIRERTGGAAQQHFNVGGYKAMRLIMPSIELQNRFAAFVEQTDKSKLAIQQSLDKMELLKKALMQKYFG